MRCSLAAGSLTMFLIGLLMCVVPLCSAVGANSLVEAILSFRWKNQLVAIVLVSTQIRLSLRVCIIDGHLILTSN